MDSILQEISDTNYFYLHDCPIGNVEYIQRNLLHQERCLENLTKQSFALDRLTRKIINELIDEMSSASTDRRLKRKWLRPKKILMGFSQDKPSDKHSNFMSSILSKDGCAHCNEGTRLQSVDI